MSWVPRSLDEVVAVLQKALELPALQRALDVPAHADPHADAHADAELQAGPSLTAELQAELTADLAAKLRQVEAQRLEAGSRLEAGPRPTPSHGDVGSAATAEAERSAAAGPSDKAPVARLLLDLLSDDLLLVCMHMHALRAHPHHTLHMHGVHTALQEVVCQPSGCQLSEHNLLCRRSCASSV